jgi:hypothetical protein
MYFIYCFLIHIISFIFVWSSARNGANAILKLFRSKNGYKKLYSSLTFMEKVMLSKHILNSKSHVKMQRYFVFVNRFHVFNTIAFLLIIVISLIVNIYKYYFYLSLLFIVFVDIPFLIFFFISTCHSTRGGVEWKFERDYRKK